MSGVLMAIGSSSTGGPIYFYTPLVDEDTPSFETVQKDSQYTWTSAGRIGRYPAMQFTGPGEETISVQGRLYPYQFGGISTLDNLRKAAATGSPLQLIRYSTVQQSDLSYVGQVVGNYVIRRVRSDSSKFTAEGVPQRIDFSLELAIYGDDLSNVTNLFTGDTTSTTDATTDSNTLSNGQPAPTSPTTGNGDATTTTNSNGGTTTEVTWT